MILSNPYGWGPPVITLHWLVDSRGLANTLNPLDHPWNFDPATVAKHRLRSIVRADRKACGDGKWVCRSYVDWVGFDVDGSYLFETVGKPRYRWERRR